MFIRLNQIRVSTEIGYAVYEFIDFMRIVDHPIFAEFVLREIVCICPGFLSLIDHHQLAVIAFVDVAAYPCVVFAVVIDDTDFLSVVVQCDCRAASGVDQVKKSEPPVAVAVDFV